MEMVPADHKADGPVRRTANYKPNIWNYDRLQSLTSIYEQDKYKREAETVLKEEVRGILGALKDPLHKLELIDGINKLGLSYYFEEEISQSVNEIARIKRSVNSSMNHGPYYTALCFRILRQYGFHVPQGELLQLLDDKEKLISSHSDNQKTIAEIFEASHVAIENECLLERAKALATYKNLKSNDDQEKIYSTKCPLHLSVSWFAAKKHMDANNKSALHRLARLSFNMVQVQHQKDLKDILRWWRNLGLSDVLTFTRDRVVESFLWAVGVAYEPQYGSLRKWLTKAIILVLIIDDVYDIYGSNHELQQFTTAVERWDPSEVQYLAEAIKRCFWVLYDTVNETDLEIQKEKGCNSVLPHLKNVWKDFCKALYIEANWYEMGKSPSLLEYLDNGWTSSSGPVLSLHILLGLDQDITESISVFNKNQEIVRHVSLIIRLSNDQGTSKDEIERGDVPSSIPCYMREANVTEEEAQDHIRNIIRESWKKINGLFIRCSNSEQPMIRYVINAARVANFIYQNGDGFGVQDRETRDQVLSCLIEPVSL